MLRNREAAKMLENIVGEDNFSEDPGIISAYTFNENSEVFGAPLGMQSKNGFPYLKLGGVIMPGSTEEVQAIVKVCNKYKICYKAHSTGLVMAAFPSKEGSLVLDLRRMNRILKIDEKNMYAVVQPYVGGGELSAELRSRGLTPHILGGGPQTSILASTTSLMGAGHTAITTSGHQRNCLGEEWVLPTGEVVSWGLVEDGKAGPPGSGYRGLARGAFGALGCLGIFTKCATKLYPWPGPAEPEVTGKGCALGWKIPDNFKVYFLGFPSSERLGDFTYKIADAGIAYFAWTYGTMYIAGKWAETNEEMVDNFEKYEQIGAIAKMKYTITVLIAGWTEKELRYKEKVLKDIMGETAAEDLLSLGIMTEFDLERFFCHAITSYKACQTFRDGGGGQGGGGGQTQNTDRSMKLSYATEGMSFHEVLEKGVREGLINDYRPDNVWFGPEEQKALGHSEYIARTDRWNPEVIQAFKKLILENMEFAAKEKLLGTGDLIAALLGGAVGERQSKVLGNYTNYQKKIEEALDPNGVMDSLFYTGRGKQG